MTLGRRRWVRGFPTQPNLVLLPSPTPFWTSGRYYECAKFALTQHFPYETVKPSLARRKGCDGLCFSPNVPGGPVNGTACINNYNNDNINRNYPMKIGIWIRFACINLRPLWLLLLLFAIVILLCSSRFSHAISPTDDTNDGQSNPDRTPSERPNARHDGFHVKNRILHCVQTIWFF